MKNYINKTSRILLMLVIPLVWSCESILDEQPFSTLANETFWQTNEDASSGVAAVYDGLQNTYNNKYFTWGEFRSDNYQFHTEGNGSEEELIVNNIQPTNDAGLWGEFYNAIARANAVIKFATNIPNVDPTLIGEAHMARAMLYFDAFRVWGKAPFFTEPVEGPIKVEATDGMVILNDAVIPDMLKAKEMITRPASKHRFSKNSVRAFMAEVYFWTGKYAEAKIELQEIIDSKEYRLATTREEWTGHFINDPGTQGPMIKRIVQDGPEIVFSLDFDITDDTRSGVWTHFFAGLPSYIRSEELNSKWLDRFPNTQEAWELKYPGVAPPADFIVEEEQQFGDWRYFETWEQNPNTGLKAPRVAKYTKTNYTPREDDTNIIIYRYSGLLLMLAEVENKLGNGAAAVALLNQVRTARQLPNEDPTILTAAVDIENMILDERQFELVGEGKRWWDLRRTNKVVEVMGPINGQTDAKLYFPIHQNHLITNDKLIQTDGYR